MADTVFRAIDASLLLAVDDAQSPEGAVANGLISQYDLSNTVGRLVNVTIRVESELLPFYEIGNRYPGFLRPGAVSVSGSAERAHVNGALLRLLLGDGAASPPAAANFVQPSFNVISTLKDPARPDQQTRVTIFGVKFDSWQYGVPNDSFVMER